MEALGKRKVDELGRITLPTEFRKENGWNEGDTVFIYQVKDTIYMELSKKLQEPARIFCGKPESKLSSQTNPSL